MDLRKLLQELCSDIKKEIQRRISEYGTNTRIGKNTLIGSNLEASIDVRPISDQDIVFEIADYYQAVVLGWSRTGNYQGTFASAIDNLSKWAVKHGLVKEGKTAVQVAFALWKSIVNRGIQGRPFLGVDLASGERIGEKAKGDPSIVLPFLDEFFSDWADKVFEEVTKELDNYFN